MECCFCYKKRLFAVALLLCMFIGFTGAHRFYTGSPGYGKFLLFTLGGVGLLWLFDLILLFKRSIFGELFHLCPLTSFVYECLPNYHCGDGHYFV